MTQAHPAETPIFKAVLWPHRSLGPRGFQSLMLAVAIASTFMSLPFFMIGAWPVVGFLGLDVLLIFLAFRWSYRTARAREEVSLSLLELSVKKTSHWGRTSEFRFNPAWVRLHREEDDEYGLTRLAIAEQRRMVDVGGFLAPVERADFAKAFSAALNQAKRGAVFS